MAKLADSGGYNFRNKGETAMPKAGKGGPAKLRELTITPAMNGGHIVEHRFQSSGNDSYKEPETHAFEGEQAPVSLPSGHILQHVASALGIKHKAMKTTAPVGGEEGEES